MKVEVIRTSGEREEHVVKKGDLEAVKKLIGVETADTVTLADRKRIMIVDDDGYDTELVDHGQQPDPRRPGETVQTWENKCVRAKKPVNEQATLLYWEKCGRIVDHKIVGDVAIVFDRDFE